MPAVSRERTTKSVGTGGAVAPGNTFGQCWPIVTRTDLVYKRAREAMGKVAKRIVERHNGATEHNTMSNKIELLRQYSRNNIRSKTVRNKREFGIRIQGSNLPD